MRPARIGGIALLGVALLAALGMAPAPATPHPVQWSAKMVPATLKPGQHARVALTATIKPGWHVYGLGQPPGGPTPTLIALAKGPVFESAGAATGPKPHIAFDPNFQLKTQFYLKSAVFTVPLTVAKSARTGPETAHVTIRFQTCNDELCLPPQTVSVAAAAQIVAAHRGAAVLPVSTASISAAPPSAPVVPPPAPARAPRGLLAFLGLACAMGALSLLTPCVFPMIPITVSYFTKSAGESRRSALRGAVLYAVGIIATFTALGAALALLFGAAGVDRLASNPWVNLVITVIFLGFALALFGTFMLRLPSGISQKLGKLGSRQGTAGGTIGTLLMGLTFSVTSFTCTAPFVGTLLVLAAQGSWRMPILGMLAFSTVFALPFFFLALAPQLVSQLPRSGEWLQAVKVVMGFLEIAAAMKFLANADLIWHWNIFTRPVVLAVWVVCGLAIVIYLLGKLPMPHHTPLGNPSFTRGALAVITLVATAWLATGLWGHRLGELESFLPPAPLSVSANGGAQDAANAWIINNLSQAQAQARREGRPLFIDFTGYTCTNCRWMEANMFPRPRVQSAMNQFVRVELYTDGANKLDAQQQQFESQKFGTVALPLYAIVSPGGKTLATFPGLTRSSDEFLSFLVKHQSRVLE